MRFKKGMLLDYVSVIRENASIYTAGRKYFGIWTQSLRAAGLDPREHLKQMPGGKYPDKASVIKALKARKRLDKPLNTTSMQADDRPLLNSAYKFFNSWKEALFAAGLDPDK